MTAYTAATNNLADTITTTATDSANATVTIDVDGAAIASGSAATWADGANTVTIMVTNGTSVTSYIVTVTKETVDSSLSALSIGSLTLTPTFDGEETDYTAATTNATNTITATAADAENATVVILVGETPVASGSAATWADGANTVTITVTNGTASTVYTVVVTKS